MDNKIFGRGAIDDKGPVISSIYAMKSVMESQAYQKGLRLFLVLTEEMDWKFMDHLKKPEDPPFIVFIPILLFPVYLL